MRRRSPFHVVCAAWLGLFVLPLVPAVCQACATDGCGMLGEVLGDAAPHRTETGNQAAASETAAAPPPCHATPRASERSAPEGPRSDRASTEGVSSRGGVTPLPSGDEPMACCFDDAATLESSVPAPAQTSNGQAVDVLADLALGATLPSARAPGEIPSRPLDPRAAPPLFTLHAALLI